MASPFTRESILTPEALHSQAEDLANRAENPPIFKIYDCIGGWYCTLLRPLFPTAIWLVRLFLSILFWPFFLSAWFGPRHEPKTKFIHNPLPGERYIRLLRVLDGSEGRISVVLDVYPLDSRELEYTALSYTWGNAVRFDIRRELWATTPHLLLAFNLICWCLSVVVRDLNDDFRRTISINGRDFTVGENLYDALIELRRRKITCPLWIDAICINQSDPVEKSHQVLAMDKIYFSAQRVIIWLGKEMAWDSAMFLDAEEILDRLDLLNSDADEYDYDMLDRRFLRKLRLSTGEVTSLTASYLTFFHSRRWFSRAWVAQELALAREVTMFCGSTTLNFNKMAPYAAIAVINSDNPGHWLANLPVQLDELRALVQDSSPTKNDTLLASRLTGLEASTPEEHWYLNMIYLLETLRDFQASQAQDKLYAIYGIASKLSPSYMPPWLRVDYSISAEELYRLFAQGALDHLSTLTMLSFAVGIRPQKPAELPSWCPDYRVGTKEATLMPLLKLEGFRLQNAVSRRFCASGSWPRRSPVSKISGDILSVTGKNIGTIAETSLPLKKWTFGDSGSNSADTSLFFCSKMDEIYHLTGQDRVEVLWRTMMCDVSTGRGRYSSDFKAEFKDPAPAQCVEWFKAWVLATSATTLSSSDDQHHQYLLLNWTIRNRTFDQSSVALPSIDEIVNLSHNIRGRDHRLETGDYEFEAVREGNNFSREASAACWGRRLIRMSHGHFGLAPETAEPGDQVWLLQCAQVPFVLRPRLDGRYSLVGETYIHGIMFGEAVDCPGGRDDFVPIEIA